MNENKHGCLELPPANLKSQIWADGQRETVIRKPQFVGKTVSSESSDKISVRVKDGMSLRNGMWLGLRNDIIMRNLIIYGK